MPTDLQSLVVIWDMIYPAIQAATFRWKSDVDSLRNLGVASRGDLVQRAPLVNHSRDEQMCRIGRQALPIGTIVLVLIGNPCHVPFPLKR